MYASLCNPETLPFFRPAHMNNRRIIPKNESVSTRETKTGRFTFVLEPSLLKDFTEYSESLNEDASEVARRAIRNEISGISVSATTGMDEIQLPLVAKVPCGPMAEAISDPAPFHITEQTADYLDANARVDQMFIAQGESMEGAGIEDGAALLIRPYPHGTPRKRDVALIQVFDEDGSCRSTVKRVIKWGATPSDVILHDGDDEIFVPDGDPMKFEAVGAVKGLISTYNSR